MTTEGSTLLSNSQLRHAGLPGGVAGVAAPGPRLEGGGARGVSGERLQLNTGLHRHNLTGDREFKVSRCCVSDRSPRAARIASQRGDMLQNWWQKLQKRAARIAA